MIKIEIDVIEISVVADIIAEAGDVLLVFNGVCVGVRPKAVAIASPKALLSYAQPPIPSPSVLRERVLNYISSQKTEVTGFMVSAELGFTSPTARQRISETLGVLAKRNLIVGSSVNGSGRRSWWKKA